MRKHPGQHVVGVSIAPDIRVTALRNHKLELINLTDGSVRVVPGGFTLGSWSPDGKWLAGIRTEDTFLMAADTLAPGHTLGTTDLVWSPDSRYLLGNERELLCGAYAATLVAVDVESGKRTRITSSRCRIDRGTVGWVSSEVAP